MSLLKESIKKEKEIFSEKIKGLESLETLEALRVDFLGRKGLISKLMKDLKSLSIEEKRACGPEINAFKDFALDQIETKKLKIRRDEIEVLNKNEKEFDVTAYKKELYPKGQLHFYTNFIEEIEDIFTSMGFQIFSGPEVESDKFNFTYLNIPEDHPARDMYDTLWVDVKDHLLRTHTSPVQIHSMINQGAPIAGIAPGRVFRHENIDATHEVVFTQCEGILIDKNIKIPNLFGVAEEFLKALFKTKKIETRVRPGFFPFVEPGFEIDMQCIFCKDGCSVCKKTGWIEVFPGGMIHPTVLKNGQIDPEVYSGFAFGFGIDRLAMLRHKINDIRMFKSGDIRFLKQFS